MSCEQERAAWEAADATLSQSLQDRAVAAQSLADAQAAEAEAQQALDAAVSARGDAETSLAEADAQVGSDSQAAGNAYDAWIQCITGQQPAPEAKFRPRRR